MGSSHLFKFDLTPQRCHLITEVRRCVHAGTLATSQLQLALLHFREAKFGDPFWEWGSTVAHVRRDQGMFWTWALNVWATHVFYEHFDPHEPQIDPLPLDVFNSIRALIKAADIRDLRLELAEVFPHGISKEELLATLDHLYRAGVSKKPSRRADGFVHLRGPGMAEDARLVARLIAACEDMALNVAPDSMTDVVNAIDRVYATIDPRHIRFTPAERSYLQLHLLVVMHNLLFDIDVPVLKSLTAGKLAADSHSMLTVTTDGDNLEVSVGFFYFDGPYLDTRSIRSNDGLERYYYPLLTTDLKTADYLVESDRNIRACLFNHPLSVRKINGRPVLVALRREVSRFKPTRSRFR